MPLTWDSVKSFFDTVYDRFIEHFQTYKKDTIYQSYLKIYGMCSETFQLTPKDANDVVTIFWIAFAVGRLSGIFLTPFFRSWTRGFLLSFDGFIVRLG